MIPKSVLKIVIIDQKEELGKSDKIVEREIESSIPVLSGSSTVIVKGVRRCGKSTLLRHIINNNFKNEFYYLNFDDDRIASFTSDDFQYLMESMIEIYGQYNVILLDEVQNVRRWELFVNRLLRSGMHVYITGSNANLLSKEIGTHLTGRHVDIELFPFSFREYLSATGDNVPANDVFSTSDIANTVNRVEDFMYNGGMPESVILGNSLPISQLIPDIIQKDIVNRYAIRRPAEIKIMTSFLLNNVSNEITFRSISRSTGIKSETTVRKYIDYFRETYLMFVLERYTKKIKAFSKSPKKIYCIDNGLVILFAPGNKGRLLENMVAVHLRRHSVNIYYFRDKDKAEVDFLIPDEQIGIQVYYELDSNNMKREIRGLIRAANQISINKLMIIIYNQEDVITYDNYTINIVPVWKFLLFDKYLKNQ